RRSIFSVPMLASVCTVQPSGIGIRNPAGWTYSTSGIRGIEKSVSIVKFQEVDASPPRHAIRAVTLYRPSGSGARTAYWTRPSGVRVDGTPRPRRVMDALSIAALGLPDHTDAPIALG